MKSYFNTREREQQCQWKRNFLTVKIQTSTSCEKEIMYGDSIHHTPRWTHSARDDQVLIWYWNVMAQKLFWMMEAQKNNSQPSRSWYYTEGGTSKLFPLRKFNGQWLWGREMGFGDTWVIWGVLMETKSVCGAQRSALRQMSRTPEEQEENPQYKC